MGVLQKFGQMTRTASIAVLLLCLLWQKCEFAALEAWNYGDAGPTHWPYSFPDCNGPMQSPININTSTVLYDSSLEPLDISDYYITSGVHMKLENVGGHTAEVIVSGTPLYLKGGSLPARYKLEQLHFHWGKNSSVGSEHSINGRFAPAELHIVHRQERFSNVGLAAASPHGLTVLSFLFKVGKHNPGYDTLIEHLQEIPEPDDEVEIPTFPVNDLIPKTFDYYRYEGSLTTPPCYESATWSISLTQVEISESQLRKFRLLHQAEHKPLVDDFRPIQPLNHRTVLVSRRPQPVWNFPG
ncbi:unnamed protein product [Candidula unifasciata]|uniref:carbonic anhydrase n=1 Tax=Candidula unifasciata TaxID=100452 RepID=A0A8S3Z1F0_9EUPU|nr:unnamed protein product [Candidula unifasciata]